MLGQDVGENTSDKMWDELKDRARALVGRLEEGDFPGASSAIEELNNVRDRNIYREVGKLTRGLHDAIVNFDIDTSHADLDTPGEESASKMANAQDRLDYVINLTQSSADKTMDMVEEGIPVAAALGERAAQLKGDWERLIRREMQPDEFRSLYHRIDQFLDQTKTDSNEIGAKFNAILMAQDFQDLTGQVIKKVITLVQEVEERLVDLMRVAGQVEELTGIVRAAEVKRPPKEAQSGELDSAAEGPQIHAEQRSDVVSGQDDVDDLLSSLGF